MKFFEIYLIFLKVVLVIQFILITLRLQDQKHVVFLSTNILFKLSLGLFIVLFFTMNRITEINYWDQLIIGFAGALLMYDAIYNDLPEVLALYKIEFNPYMILPKI